MVSEAWAALSAALPVDFAIQTSTRTKR